MVVDAEAVLDRAGANSAMETGLVESARTRISLGVTSAIAARNQKEILHPEAGAAAEVVVRTRFLIHLAAFG